MKKILPLILILLTFSADGQPDYAAYQLTYKTGLANELHIDTSKVKFYPINKALLVNATVELLKEEPVFDMITSSGKTKEAVKYARLHFNYQDKSYTLYAYQLIALKNSAEHATHFFVPFKDAASGKGNYGGGRYLDFTAADIQAGKLLIDFNKAYNPSCAFVTGYNCPIPPPANKLPFAVNAGEKKYTGLK
ncbi:DUF1684 domain-containing protein [Foetidibacter luteolus]|uniref:DUF1684 domain-containing protein n=1 Tax=Foetidibacter luteolus TaxID=2608880 RepID=UPI00129BF951|nr:DUF1684 domain-containing protein [Foetidibacter luteolus]